MDGETLWTDDFTGYLSGDRVGICFHTDPPMELYFALQGITDLQSEAVCSDYIRLALLTPSGTQETIEFVFAAQHLVVGKSFSGALPCVCTPGDPIDTQERGVRVYGGGRDFCALETRYQGPQLRFAFAHGHTPQEAAARAREGLWLDLDAQITKKRAFYQSLPQLEAPAAYRRLFAKCCSVMKTQVYTAQGMFDGQWTTPDRLPHRNLWLWDSVFHSLGNRHIDPALSLRSLWAVLETQRDDGFIAHMATPESVSKITQPPLLAWGFYQYYAATGDRGALEKAYGALKAYLFWNRTHRDRNCNFLYEWALSDSIHCRCDECGMDNSPRFDAACTMDAIDFSCYMANETRTMAKIAEIIGLAEQADMWRKWFAAISQAINRFLWDEQDGLYYDRLTDTGQLYKVKAVSSFLPLFAGVCSPQQASRLVLALQDPRQFGAAFGVPSVSADDPTFGTDMWRGPVWINFNYMIILGLEAYGYAQLAQRLSAQTIETMRFWYEQNGVLYEFYDSCDRISPANLNRKTQVIRPYLFDIRYSSIRDYGWSCTLLADLLARRYLPKKNLPLAIEVEPVCSEDPLWPKLIHYARSCSWSAGIHLAKQMTAGAFTGWQRVFAARCGDQIAGYCTFSETDCLKNAPYRPYIGFVFVGEPYRGRRVSQKMIQTALDYAAQLGFKQVYLVSDHVGLYEKYGFVKIDARLDVWGNPESVFVYEL